MLFSSPFKLSNESTRLSRARVAVEGGGRARFEYEGRMAGCEDPDGLRRTSRKADASGELRTVTGSSVKISLNVSWFSVRLKGRHQL